MSWCEKFSLGKTSGSSPSDLDLEEESIGRLLVNDRFPIRSPVSLSVRVNFPTLSDKGRIRVSSPSVSPR